MSVSSAMPRDTRSWIGYKLHIDTADGEIPISCVLTAASVHDSQLAIPLATITATRVTNLYDLMDSAYDDAEIKQHSRDLGHVPIIDTNPRRTPGLKQELAQEAKRQRLVGHRIAEDVRYGERSTAERVNGGLKDNHGGCSVRSAGTRQSHVPSGCSGSSASLCCNCCVWSRSGAVPTAPGSLARQPATTAIPACPRRPKTRHMPSNAGRTGLNELNSIPDCALCHIFARLRREFCKWLICIIEKKSENDALAVGQGNRTWNFLDSQTESGCPDFVSPQGPFGRTEAGFWYAYGITDRQIGRTSRR